MLEINLQPLRLSTFPVCSSEQPENRNPRFGWPNSCHVFPYQQTVTSLLRLLTQTVPPLPSLQLPLNPLPCPLCLGTSPPFLSRNTGRNSLNATRFVILSQNSTCHCFFLNTKFGDGIQQAIRKKIESELSRKRTISTTHQAGRSRRGGKTLAAKGTVAALKPTAALTVPENISVAEASQLCAAKRTDCVLVVDDEEGLSGIFTAKDLAYRVCYFLLSCSSVSWGTHFQ